MKKVFALFIAAGMVTFMACGSAQDKEKEAKRIADSIRVADSTRIADSLTKAAEAVVDTLAATVDSAKKTAENMVKN